MGAPVLVVGHRGGQALGEFLLVRLQGLFVVAVLAEEVLEEREVVGIVG